MFVAHPVVARIARAAVAAVMLTALGAFPALAQVSAAPPAPDHDAHQAADDQRYPSLKISGFGDVNLAFRSQPEGARGFSLGQFALHMTSELSPRVTFFGELSFSARADAGTGSPPATGFNTEVERMILRFDQSDRLKVSFGRYHTPINWWNTAFHHGQWLQTTIARPEMIQFGGRFLPVHFIGGLVEGSVPAGGWHLRYQGGVGNGRSSVISRGGDAGDSNSERAAVVTLSARPDRAYALQVGGSYYTDTITLSSGRAFGERIAAAHMVWQREDPEVIAEVAAVRHAEDGQATVAWSRAFYLQAAYRLPQLRRMLKPYYRFEHIGVSADDAVFQGLPALDGSTLGMRADVSPLAAIKFEYRTWTRGPSVSRNHGGFFQVCFTF